MNGSEQVWERRRSEEHVACEELVGRLELVNVVGPADVLGSERRDEALRKVDFDVAQLYQEVTRATKLKDQMLKKLKAIDQERAAVKKETETIKGQGGQLEREIEIEKREALAAKAQAVEVRAELEELRSSIEGAADSTQRQVAITRLNQKMIKDLEGEIGGFKSESMKQRKMLYTLEKERERFGAEASDARYSRS